MSWFEWAWQIVTDTIGHVAIMFQYLYTKMGAFQAVLALPIIWAVVRFFVQPVVGGNYDMGSDAVKRTK